MDTVRGIPATVNRLPDLIAATHYTITRLGPPSALSMAEFAAQEALSDLMEEYAALDALNRPTPVQEVPC